MTITRRTTKPPRPKHTTHFPTAPPLDKPVFVTRPFFGIDNDSPLNDDDEDYYSEEDDDDLQEALEQQEYDSGSDDEYWGNSSTGMTEAWPSSVPNKLGNASSSSDNSDDYRSSCLGLPLSLPYEVETLEEMDDRLEYICCKLAECVKARDWQTGFKNWDSSLSMWQSMGYQMKKEMKIKLTFIYWEIIFVPGLSSAFLEDAGNSFISFITDRALSISDFRIPWRPLLDALYEEMFPHPLKPSRHSSSLAPLYLNIAESAQRFFHPGDVDEMLEAILPRATSSMDSIIATQTMLVHFLPISHCEKWLPLVFRLWHGFNSGMWDDQASDLVGQLSIAHLDPARSDPSMIAKIPRGIFNTPEEEAANPSHAKALRAHKARLSDVAGEIEEDDDGLNYWIKPEVLPPLPSQADPSWQGIRKDVGIFTDQEFEFIMSKCLRSLNVPVGGAVASSSAMSLTHSDARVSKKMVEAKKPIDRVQSLAEAIVNSMSNDAPAAPTESLAPTPGNLTPKPQAGVKMPNGKKLGDSLAAAGSKVDADKKYLGGSKALDHLSRLLTSCETFFHPSNSGHWSQFLTVFLTHLTINFVDRWKSEEEPDCKTPLAWRLTPEIKREFVLCIRPLALTAVFIKGMEAMTGAIGALKCLAQLEPDLIMPAALERAIPSLQGLEETARTPAVTYMLATLAEPLSARRIWKFGGIYVPDIFNLLLPGIDLNDPSKTGLSCMAISNMVDLIHLSDISDVDATDTSAPGARALRKVPRVPVKDDDNEPVQLDVTDLTPEEVDSRIRLATSSFRDWVPEFIGRIILLFANLPEEGGKSGKAGGKTEQLTLMSVLHTSGAVFSALDDKLFDGVLEQIYEYVTTTARGNAVDAVGELVRNMSAANSDKVFARLFPVAKQRILAELKAGASSTRTTTTSIPLASDAALHWWQSILYGMLVPGRLSLSKSEHRESYIELLQVMVDSTYSERGYVWTGKILEKSMTCLVALYFTEMSMIPEATRKTEDFKNNHTAYWGKLYRAAELKPEWRVPTAEDVNMAFEVIAIADKSAIKVGKLIESKAFGDKVWTNEFCRAVHMINQVLKGSYNLILESEASKTGGVKAESYLPDEILELPKPFKSSMILTDPNDPRHQHIQSFLQRVGETLHQAASATRDVGESDNSVECVKSLVTTIGTYLTSYGLRSKQFGSAQTAYAGMQGTKRMYDGQRKHHRSIFMGAVTIHHQNRLSSMNYYRVRSALDDRLILNMLDFCLSPFTRIRRSAQAYLEAAARIYRGTWILCFPTLFDALKQGTDPDRMKGALYVLRYNPIGITRIGRTLNWYQGQLVTLVESLLNAHHENKASAQALVSKAIEELLGSIREPTSAIVEYRVENVDKAIDSMVEILRYKPNPELIQRFNNSIRKVKAAQDEQWDILVDKVISIASDPQLNWRYVLSASRILLQVQRRDRPTDVRMAKFHSEAMLNAHPRLRDYAIATVTKMLYTVVMRHLCLTADKPEERLFLQEPYDPFTTEIELKDTSEAFVQQYFQSFREPPPEDGSQALMQDRSDTGWLVWGKTMELGRMTGPDEDAYCMDETSQEGVAIIKNVMTGPNFWQTVADYWAQEDTRSHPSAGNIDAVIASSQLFGPVIFELIKPIVDGYLAEMDSTKVYDRHKTRAMWEFICGLIRGAEEWSGNNRKLVWDWLTPKLPELFGNIRHDTVKCWSISIEFLINGRDPRRYPALFHFLIQTGLDADFANGSSFDLTQRVQNIRSLIARLDWRFSAWADEFTELYFKALSCPYAEVRALVSTILNSLDQLRFHPSYPSAKALTDDILNDPTDQKDIMQIRTAPFKPQMEEIMKTLPALKKDRPHGPKAVQSVHDLTANSILTWLIVECSDVRAVAAFTYIIPFLPEIFALRDMNDNQDLQRISGRLLAMITSITPSLELIEPLMDALMSILQRAESWRTKVHCMPVLSLVYYRNLSLLSESCKARALDVVALCLRDPNQEVREIASATLSGFLRCSQRPMVDVLRHRFTHEILSTNLPKRRDAPGQVNPEYQAKVVELHGAILGATALVEAFPYTVPKFLPKLLADVLAPKVSEPAPISTTIRNTVASFKRTHEKYQDKFTEDELSAMNYAQAGNSYYA